MYLIYLFTGFSFSVYFILVYVLGSYLGLEGIYTWYYYGGMILIGLIAAGSYIWYRFRTKEDTEEETGEGGGSDIDHLLKSAEARLAEAESDKKAKLRTMPVVLVLGKPGSTKTSVVIHGGLDPEIVAGQVYQGSDVIPTGAVNVWYASRAAFVEVGGKLLKDRKAWKRIIKRLRPAVGKSLFGAKTDASRCILVCVSCEDFFASGSRTAIEVTARELRAKLEDVCEGFGVRTPVYVAFTKADRLAFFAEYVRNLSPDEVGQAVGVTLPMDNGRETGVYAERQSQRLTTAFDRMLRSLCDRRPDILARENEANQLPGAYEFPRELRKLRPSIVQFLVELCRPSQLREGPFLRGFYFTGARAVTTQEAPSSAIEESLRQPGASAVHDATTVFNAEQARRAMQAGQQQAGVTRRIPQWLFLSRLFLDVLLGDEAVRGTKGGSVRASRWRRALLATAALVCFIWSIGLVVSYFSNRSLQTEVLNAARGIQAQEAQGGELASLDALTRLESLRAMLDTLTRYEQDGAPMRMRWGLYSGDALYSSTRRAYYAHFHQLLFGSAQASLQHTLARLPSKPAPTDEYSPIYDTLKAYLITTSHPDKSTREFLPPVLMKHWAASRPVDADRAALARKQFDFYAEDLKNSNPFSPDQDTVAIERGRKYLSQFAGLERVYQFMLAEASREAQPVNFNRQFPGSEQVVINNREISGAFTKAGWGFMREAVKNADKFFGGEKWVLGESSGTTMDPAELEQRLMDRYRNDFIAQWRDYLRVTSVVRYRSLGDAATKLNLVSGNQSPLLAALWLASQHTAVDSEEVMKAFQPVQFVVPPENKDRYISDANGAYMNALVGLQAGVDQAAQASGPARDAAVDQVNSQASAAKITTRQVAQGFRIDPGGNVGGVVQTLMEQPILYAEALVRALGPAELNAKGRSLCGQFQSLMRKYPFRPDAQQEATLQEIAAIFQPGSGALWSFYEQSLREHLQKQGSLYVANPSSKIQLNASFVNFFNRAATFSETLYPNGSQQPQLEYNVTLSPPAGMQSMSLLVDNLMLTAGRGGPASLGFRWPGTGAQQVRLSGKFGASPELTFASYQGLWAVFRFFGDADRSSISGNTTMLEWVPRQGRAGQPMTLPDGSPLTVRFDVRSGAPVFQKGYLSGFACVSSVAR